MDPYMPLTNSTAALPWCQLLLALRSPNAADLIRQKLASMPSPITNQTYYPGTPQRPAFWYGRGDSFSMLLIDGATTVAQATLLTAGYLGTTPPTIRNPQNVYLNDMAEQIIGILKASQAPPVNMRIGGYSLGGAIAQVIMTAMPVLEWGDDRGNVITFGSPKVHSQRVNAVMHLGGRCQRYMCDDDPVPLFPPNPLDYPAIIGIVGPFYAARLANFDHPTGGTILSREGTMTPGVIPSVSGLSFGVNLANWLFDIETLGGNPHALAEYEKRLLVMEANNARAFHVPQGHIVPEGQVQRNDLTQAERRVADAVAHAGQTQGHTPIVIPVNRIFKWVRVGKINCVAFGDKLITITNTKKRALRLANSGNDFLKVLQRQAVVDPVSITTQFVNYFEFATNPASGFAPIMNTVFPAIGN
jgi:hypothetical protein